MSSVYALQLCAHRWVKNERVTTRAREIWPKIVKIIDFWKGFPKSKKPGKRKTGANTSYDHLCSIQKNPVVPLKLQFFEDIAKTLNSLLILYQTNKPMVPFLADSLGTFLRSLCAKFMRKDVFESAKTASLRIKLDGTDITNRKNVNSVDLGFVIKYELKRLIDSMKVTSMQVFQFQKEALKFLASLCSHAIEKIPLRSLFARCLKCLSPK